MLNFHHNYFINGKKPCANLQPEDINFRERNKTEVFRYFFYVQSFACAHTPKEGGGGRGREGGTLDFKVSGMIKWGQKSKPPKNPWTTN